MEYQYTQGGHLFQRNLILSHPKAAVRVSTGSYAPQPHRVWGKTIIEIWENSVILKWRYLWNRLTDFNALTSG